MKKVLLIRPVFPVMVSCQEDYELSADFTVLVELNSPASVRLDVSPSVPIVLSWSGGGAADGGIVSYEVLFDKADGDFSKPLATTKSDLGANPSLLVTHAAVNTIARNTGIYPLGTGDIKWTATASKGRVVKKPDKMVNIIVTRGEGINSIPAKLYLYGPVTENSGQGGIPFRCVEEGVFQIYTKSSAGNISFKSATTDETFSHYIDDSSKLREDDGEAAVTASEEVTRPAVNSNTMAMTTEKIGSSVRCVWGVTFAGIAILEYTGNGKFVGEGDIRSYDPAKPEANPPFGWIEERYYFLVQVNDETMCWGRGDDVSAECPVGGELAPFYVLYELQWSQWECLWKTKGSLDYTYVTITIGTNADGLMIHISTNVIPTN